MRLKLKEIADVIQGSILTRIKNIDEDGIRIEAITMQELSYYCNQTDEKPETNFINISKERYSNCLISNVGDVLIGLSSGKAMVIEKNRSNKLILSNFAIVRLHDTSKIDPFYLCWLINESLYIKKQLLALFQKTGRVIVIPISEFKEIEIESCDINKQRKIGQIYNLSRRKTRLKRTKSEYTYEIINLGLKKYLKENN